MALTTVDFDHSAAGLDGSVSASGVTYGEVFRVDVACTLTALRVDFVVAGGVTTARLRLYRQGDQALLASATPTLTSGFGAGTVAPVVLAANTNYVLACYDTNLRGSGYTRTVPHTHLGTNVVVTLPAGNSVLVAGDACPVSPSNTPLELRVGVVLDTAPLTPYVPKIML